MTNAVLAIDNVLETGTVTADSEATGFEVENAFDNLLHDYWQPTSGTQCWVKIDLGSAQSLDCVGFYSSDFYAKAGALIRVYYSDNDIAYTQVTGYGTNYITTEGAKLILFTAASHRYWQITFDTTGAEQPKFQHIYLGAKTETERGLSIGFAPMALGSENEPINSESADGNFIGRSTKKRPIRTRLNFDNISETWMRTNWPTILAALESKPFLVLPQPDDYTDEAAFCWTSGEVRTPSYTSHDHMQFSIPIKARIT